MAVKCRAFEEEKSCGSDLARRDERDCGKSVISMMYCFHTIHFAFIFVTKALALCANSSSVIL